MAHVISTFGLGFGDEGKGATVDWLCRHHQVNPRAIPPLVVRYNGGPQCSHAVTLPDGRVHCFHQFGSGTLSGCRTYLYRSMIVDPLSLYREGMDIAKNFKDVHVDFAQPPFHLMSIHPGCLITTRFHKLWNKLVCAQYNVGTCGFGVGITRELSLVHGRPRVISVVDLMLGRAALGYKLSDLKEYLIWRAFENNVPSQPLKDLEVRFVLSDLLEKWTEMVGRGLQSFDSPSFSETYILEGAQGFLLDQEYGFLPNNTWSDLSTGAAMEFLSDYNAMPGKDHTHEFLGITRCYATRHGNGPFPTQYMPSRLSRLTRDPLVDPNNPSNQYQGDFRFGMFDEVLFKYACENIGKAMPLTGLVVNHMDEYPRDELVCSGYAPIGQAGLTSYLSGSRTLPGEYASKRATSLLIQVEEEGLSTTKVPKGQFLPRLAGLSKLPVVLVGNGPSHTDREVCDITPSSLVLETVS